MSEFIAEAQVLVVPNLTTFAATLKTQLEAAVAAAGPVAIPVAAAPVATGASAALAAQSAASAAAMEAEGSAAQKAAVSVGSLGKAEQAAAISAEKLAFAQTEVLGAASAVGAAEVTLTRSTAAVAAAEKSYSAAVASGNQIRIIAAIGSRQLAAAQQVEADAALVAARAQAAHNAQMAQATRGVFAQTASFAGLRAGTLAASAPFIAATASVIIFAKALREASDRTEELNKTAVVFGQSAKEIKDFAETTATSLGISEVEALRAAGIFGNLFRSIDIGQRPAAAMSEQLVRLASDLASFNNADPSRVLEALRSGLVGQARPLRVFGVFLSQARAQQEALIETGKQNVKALTNEELVRARFNIILKDTTLAQGDFARTLDREANQSRILKAQLSDLGGSLGTMLLPGVLLVTEGLNTLTEDLLTTTKAAEEFIGLLVNAPALQLVVKVVEDVPGGGTLEGFFSRFGSLLKAAAVSGVFPGATPIVLTAEALRALGVGGEKAAEGVTHVGQSLEQASEHGRGAANGIGVAVDQINHLFISAQNAASALEVMNLKIQTGLVPGGRPAQEANLLQQIEQDKKAIAAADSGSKAKRQALEELAADQKALAALQEQDAQDAKDQANKVKAAAQDAARAQAEATQAFIELFAPRQQALQNRITTAQLFGTARQQIAANQAVVAADRAEIRALQQLIVHKRLHGDALKAAQAEIARLNQEIFNTTNAIIQLQRARRQTLADARQSHLEAQLAIAETTASTKDDVAAQKALIRFDQQQIRRILAIKRRRRLTQEEAAQLDAYRVDLAQRNAELKKTTETVKDTGQKFKELTFAFLQTQAGFAANLLGNLIPGSATAGLVGGTTATGGFGQPGGPQPGGGVIPGMDVSGGAAATAAVSASRDRGVRPVQVDTTNQLLRHILRVLQQQTGRMGHPEARYQKATGSAIMDTEHGHG